MPIPNITPTATVTSNGARHRNNRPVKQTLVLTNVTNVTNVATTHRRNNAATHTITAIVVAVDTIADL